MDKIILKVPRGIRYISQWTGYDLNDFQFKHILNKTITGCGFTEYCLTNRLNVILLSPRKMLLENKESQHSGNVFYARNEIDSMADYDKDISSASKKSSAKFKRSRIELLIKSDEAIQREKELEKLRKQKILAFKQEIQNYYYNCVGSGMVCKILVTYDSFRHVKEALGDRINDFYVVVDEFQAILVDSHFKSTAEIEILKHLQDLNRVCFVSATPVLDRYLNMLEEFRDLPYYELDWKSEDPGRVMKPRLEIKFTTRNLSEDANRIIRSYLDGKFEKYFIYSEGTGTILDEIVSNEAAIFVNSVRNICSIIKSNKLLPSNCNVLCSNTSANNDRVRRAFNDVIEYINRQNEADPSKPKMKKIPTKVQVIGTIPKKGEPHKMFTLCTRTVYLGADFYSPCARTFILSDANIDCLAVDVSTDLEQILGRQRLEENPWKNSAYMVVKLSDTCLTREQYLKRLDEKDSATIGYIELWKNGSDVEKKLLVDKYEEAILNGSSYINDYVAINVHSGSQKIPVFNNLVRVSEVRAFDIQQVDYKDRFNVFSAMSDKKINTLSQQVVAALSDLEDYPTFTSKMKFLCDQENVLSSEEYKALLNNCQPDLANYVRTLGTDKIKSCSYQRSKILEKLENKVKTSRVSSNDINERIALEFEVGKKYTNVDAKNRIKKIYDELGVSGIAPSTTPVRDVFVVKAAKLMIDGAWINGFQIISKK